MNRELVGERPLSNPMLASLCGILPTDTKLEAAKKVVKFMRAAELPTENMENLIADYILQMAIGE